jgi:uncharacterized protein (TIRG00374 family)
MNNKKKIILNALLFFGIFGLTVWSVFHGENLGEIQDALMDCDVAWLIPAVACVFLFICGEAAVIWYLMRSYGIHIKKGICFLFSSVGFFFSCVTPSATGGQPMQIYFMRKEKIPVPISTVILMIVTITYKMVLVVVGLGVLLFGRGFCEQYMTDVLPVFYLGIGLNVFCVASMIMLVFHPTFAKNALCRCIALLEKCHILKHKEHRLSKLENSMDIYHETAAFLRENYRLVVHVFLITVFQRMALFAVPCFVYNAFHLSGVSWWTILILQASISVSVDMLPLPGGMGISESLFQVLFAPVFGELILPGMVLSRGLGYYSELLFSALFTLVAVAFFSQRKSSKNTLRRGKKE